MASYKEKIRVIILSIMIILSLISGIFTILNMKTQKSTHIYLSNIYSKALNWESPYYVFSESISPRSMTVTTNGTILCSVQDGDIYRSDDNGTTWWKVCSNPTGYWDPWPSLVSNNSDVIFMVYHRYVGNDNTYMRISTDYGLSWGLEKPVATTGINENYVYLYLTKNGTLLTPGNQLTNTNLLYFSNNWGETWSNKSLGSNMAWTVIVELDNGDLMVIYKNTTNNYIYFKKSSDFGASWSSPTLFLNGIDGDIGAAIVVNGAIYFTYIDNSNDNLYSATSYDDGESWSIVFIDSNVNNDKAAAMALIPGAYIGIIYDKGSSQCYWSKTENPVTVEIPSKTPISGFPLLFGIIGIFIIVLINFQKRIFFKVSQGEK